MKIITLDDPRYPGTYAVEEQEKGRLVLEPVIGPRIDELVDRGGGRKLTGEEFERLCGNLGDGAGRGAATGASPRLQVAFDDEAFWLDVRRHKPGSQAAHTAQSARRALERERLPRAQLQPCWADGSDRARLGDLLKVYLPLGVAAGKRQPFAMMLAPALEHGELVLRYAAFGARQRPPGSRSPSVDEITLARRHGAWP